MGLMLKHSQEIEYLENISQSFLDELLSEGPDAHGVPFLVSDATKDWPCMQQWSFDWFKRKRPINPTFPR